MDDKPPSVSEELNRKVLETMRNLEIQKAELAISDYEYGIAVKAIASCVLGLVDRDVTEIISLSEKIPVHTFPAYVRKPTVIEADGDLKIFWVDEDGVVEAAPSLVPGSFARMSFEDFPWMNDPHKLVSYYNKWLSSHTNRGWRVIGND